MWKVENFFSSFFFSSPGQLPYIINLNMCLAENRYIYLFCRGPFCRSMGCRGNIMKVVPPSGYWKRVHNTFIRSYVDLYVGNISLAPLPPPLKAFVNAMKESFPSLVSPLFPPLVSLLAPFVRRSSPTPHRVLPTLFLEIFPPFRNMWGIKGVKRGVRLTPISHVENKEASEWISVKGRLTNLKRFHIP